VDLLGLFGIGELVEAIRAGVHAHAAALTMVAHRVSGFHDLLPRLQIALGGRADVLKAAAALQTMLARAAIAGERALQDSAQRLLDSPEMFPLQAMDMARLLAGGRVRPPAQLAEQAWTVITTGLEPATLDQARSAAVAWREWAQLAGVPGAHVARVMVRAWQLAATEGGASDGR
jgi:hypothetical protein